MKVVIDTNILMAGLIKDSIVREILISRNIEFFLPEKAIEEIRKYQRELCKKAEYTKKEFERLFSYLLYNLKIVSKNKIKPYMKKAEKIMEKIDVDDSSFIATCLAINADGILTFDKHFKRQNIIKVLNIKEIIKFI
ncbi:MAG: PIN domain-containing protein [Nanoarchaeota archaeon]